MVNQLYLNRVIIWRPKLKDEFAVRESPKGRTYFENGVARITKEPTYRYAKNYTIGKGKNAVKFCLMFLTPSAPSTSGKNIEKFLDETAQKIDIAQVQMAVLNATNVAFEYTDFYFKEDK